MSYMFMKFPGFLSKAVTLSYDDGVRSDKRLIEIMKRNGIKGTFNLNSGCFSDGDPNYIRMTRQEVFDTYHDSGMEVAIHGKMHYSLTEISEVAVINEVMEDRKNLEKLFNRIINGMAYPNGSYNDKVVEILGNCGIKYSRTCNDTESFDLPTDWLRLSPTCHHTHPKLMDLAEKFIKEKDKPYYWLNTPKLFYLWGHSYEFDDDNNWDLMEKFCELVGNRKDIWYATNGEIYSYVTAYNNLVQSADGKYIYNPSAIDVYLTLFNKNKIVKAGETISTDF